MTHEIDRRRFVACFSSFGLGASLMPGALAAVAQDAPTITLEMVEAAQTIAGLSFTAAAPVRRRDRSARPSLPSVRPVVSGAFLSLESRPRARGTTKRSFAGGDDIRELIVDEFLVLYLVRGDRVVFLSIKHHRQLSYDLKAFWRE